MWNFRMYEWLANERITTYQREAERERRSREYAAARARTPVAATTTAKPLGRRALAAAFVGLAAITALRRRQIP